MHNRTGQRFEDGGVGEASRGWSGKRKGIPNDKEKEGKEGELLFLGHLHAYLYCIGAQELGSGWVGSTRDKRYVGEIWRSCEITQFHSFKRFFCIHHRILLLLVLVCLNVLYFSVVSHIIIWFVIPVVSL